MQLKNDRTENPIVREGKSFLSAVSQSSEPVYLVLFTLYVIIFFILKTAWDDSVSGLVSNIRYGLLSVVMWGSTLYLFFVIAAWKNLWRKNIPLILTGGILLGATFYFSRIMSTNAYGVVMDIFFCLMACGKHFRRIIRCTLWAGIGMLLLAFIGVRAGFTLDMMKPENVSPGHSLGINYPNTWGYLVFLVMLIAWYLYMRHRPILAFPFFWGICAFMYLYISCRTVALLTAVFPVMATAVDLLEQAADRKVERRIAEGAYKNRIGPLGWIVVAIPILAFAFMLFASMQYEWVHAHFYHTKLHTFAMRFVQGGLYFKTYGFPIFGNPYRSNQYTYVNVNGSFEQVGILDSSFAAYMIMRGMVWLTYTLLWLCIANWKALKKRDYAIPFLCGIILVFAMMERPGLEMWYNFILLYPLARVASKPGTEEPQPVEAPVPAADDRPVPEIPDDLPLPEGATVDAANLTE